MTVTIGIEDNEAAIVINGKMLIKGLRVGSRCLDYLMEPEDPEESWEEIKCFTMREPGKYNLIPPGDEIPQFECYRTFDIPRKELLEYVIFLKTVTTTQLIPILDLHIAGMLIGKGRKPKIASPQRKKEKGLSWGDTNG